MKIRDHEGLTIQALGDLDRVDVMDWRRSPRTWIAVAIGCSFLAAALLFAG